MRLNVSQLEDGASRIPELFFLPRKITGSIIFSYFFFPFFIPGYEISLEGKPSQNLAWIMSDVSMTLTQRHGNEIKKIENSSDKTIDQEPNISSRFLLKLFSRHLEELQSQTTCMQPICHSETDDSWWNPQSPLSRG